MRSSLYTYVVITLISQGYYTVNLNRTHVLYLCHRYVLPPNAQNYAITAGQTYTRLRRYLLPNQFSQTAKVVGGQRVAPGKVLFQPPLPKPRMSLSISRDFPVAFCQHKLTVSISLRAERITRVLSTNETWQPAPLRPVRDFLALPGAALLARLLRWLRQPRGLPP